VVRLFPAVPLVGIVLVGAWIWALFDVVYTERYECRYLPKWLWFAIVFIFFAFGVVLWVAIGRPRRIGIDPVPRPRRAAPRRPGLPRPGEPRYLGEYDVTDRRSADLDRELEEWERRTRDEDE
jgi:hypothetical protein